MPGSFCLRRLSSARSMQLQNYPGWPSSSELQPGRRLNPVKCTKVDIYLGQNPQASTCYFFLLYILCCSLEAFKVILMDTYYIRKYKLDIGKKKKKSKRKTRDRSKADVTLLLCNFLHLQQPVRGHIAGVSPVPSLTGPSVALRMGHGGSKVDS